MRQLLGELLQDILIGIALGLIVIMFVGQSRVVPTESMYPTIAAGDRIFSEKITYRFRPPRRGELVVFMPPFESEEPFIKRVIGLPGETVEIREGKVFINGEPLEEDYIAEPPAYELPPVTIPEGYYLVLGDNRNRSHDSHVWGLLEGSRIRERALFRYWPLSHFTWFGSP